MMTLNPREVSLKEGLTDTRKTLLTPPRPPPPPPPHRIPTTAHSFSSPFFFFLSFLSEDASAPRACMVISGRESGGGCRKEEGRGRGMSLKEKIVMVWRMARAIGRSSVA